jgi:plasmid stabilization system protein ParE
MAYRVKLMPRAQRDLSEIYDWIGAESSNAAFAWYRRLRESIGTLGNSPRPCPISPEDPNLRHLLYGEKPHVYRVIYRVLEKQRQVHVLHIRHGARRAFKAKELM